MQKRNQKLDCSLLECKDMAAGDYECTYDGNPIKNFNLFGKTTLVKEPGQTKKSPEIHIETWYIKHGCKYTYTRKLGFEVSTDG